jgi:hypothetical protein
VHPSTSPQSFVVRIAMVRAALVQQAADLPHGSDQNKLIDEIRQLDTIKSLWLWPGS